MDIYLQLFFIVLSIVLAPVGFLGGRWLWQKMAQSPLLIRMQKYIRPIGIVGTISMFASAVACVVVVVMLPCYTLYELARPVSIGGESLLAYLVGYDISIMKNLKSGNVNRVPLTSPTSPFSFQIRRDLVKKVFLHVFSVFLIPYLILAAFSLVRWDLIFDLLLIAGGGSVGYLFWEHLKETGILVGSFLKHLLLLSLATTGVMAFIFGYSINVAMCYCGPYNPQIPFISIALFTECMGWYMLSLPLTLRDLGTAHTT